LSASRELSRRERQSSVSIVAEELRVRLSGVEVLRGVNVNLGPGVTALVGRNGAGKTTLIRVLTGSLVPSSGSVVRDGGNIFASDDLMSRHHSQLGWLPQEPGGPPRMRVQSLVGYAAWLKRIPACDRPEAVDVALAHTDLVDLRRERLGRLSGGQRRRASLAAAIVGGPEVLVLDEPTNGLDPVQRAQFLHSVRTLARDRIVLVATHLLEDVALVADRWFALDSGRLVANGEVDRSSPEGATASTELIRSVIADRQSTA
jgi:ABC-2 type transport system ATP-binding protein